jgi:endonuclease/exonuclease/phosphatase family metal-dependent hydrolase
MEPDPRMTADQPETLKVASYNIRKAVGADRRHNPERIMRVLAETGADIAVLQEADRRLGERPSALPAGLVEAAGWQVVPVATSRSGIGWHGNAILVSPRIDIIRGARLKLPMLEPRGAVLADLAISGQPLRIWTCRACGGHGRSGRSASMSTGRRRLCPP